MGKKRYQYAIKYKVKCLNKDEYMLVPDTLLKGRETRDGFSCLDGNNYSILIDSINPKAKVYVDMIYSADELEEIFPELVGEDEEFKASYFYENYKSFDLYINANDVTDSGVIRRHMIEMDKIDNDDPTMDYFMNGTTPCALLNEKSFNEIMESKNWKEAKLRLTSLKLKLKSMKKMNRQKGVTLLRFKNGKIDSCMVNKEVDTEEVEKELEKRKNISSNSGTFGKREISYVGLRDYIKERVYGHDKEIETFAQKIYMNYTAIEGEPIESIILVGPTGVGKTETVVAARDYLGIPWYEINSSNLIAQGIVGTSIEDVIISLYERAGKDLKKAQRGLIFLDEFDKLHETTNETKSDVKNILLTFTAGGCFPISNSNYNFTFDTTMTNKIYAGVFERICDKKNPIGFGTGSYSKVQSLGTPEEVREKIMDKKYLSLEELSRISTLLVYDELPRETKKDILLNCKSSVYVKKRDRYKRQFGIDLVLDEDCIDELLDKQSRVSTGMRAVNNSFNHTIDEIEKQLLENEDRNYKKLILTRDTVSDPKKFNIM